MSAGGAPADHRLAAYGTLRPGERNHRQLAGLSGEWIDGTLHARFATAGWAVANGYPALILDDAAPALAIALFVSPDLPRHWRRLDRFEGPGYRRVQTTVTTAEGAVPAWVYVAADAGRAPA